VTFVAKLPSRNWVIPIVALISPYRTSPAEARDTIGQDKFIEVYVKVSLSTCEERDAKGLCGRARRREILDMTGVQDPYGKPLNLDIVVDTEGSSLEHSVVSVVKELRKFGHLAG
jgi:adenylylsulfate kinase